MKNNILGNLSLSLVACAVLAGCGSDDKDELPTVSVASAVELKESRSTTITATATDDDDTINYSWSQISGPTLTLTNTTTATVGITAPAVDADGAAVLRVTVTDRGEQTATADVTVNVANNVLPTVTASFNAAAEKSNVTLTAVAADEDGEIESYSWVQTAGTPVTLTGADTATLSFTAPSVTANTELAFSLTVTDDDEEASSVAGTVTVTPVMTTFSVTGTVAEPAFANAEVSGVLAGVTFTTTADANGVFSLPLQADDDETNLFANITARSVTSAGVEFYKFVPSLTADVAEPVAASIATKLSSAVAALFDMQPMAEGDDSPNQISINAVSTALYSLIIAANGGTAPADLDSFTLVEKSVSPDELIEAAAVVKLITQGGDFALPEGVSSVLELLSNTQAYNDYVAAAEVIDPGIITDTIEEIIADPELTPPVEESAIASTYYEVYPAASGFLSRGGNRFDFNQDGTGSETYGNGTSDFTWELVDGVIELTYSGESGNIGFPTAAVGVAGLTQEQVNLLNEAGYYQVEVTYTTTSSSMKRIVAGEKTDSYRITTVTTDTMTPITLPGGTVISPAPIVRENTSDQLLRNADKLADIKFVEADMAGVWVFEHYYYAGEPDLGYSNVFADMFTINADGTGSTFEAGKTFNWEVNDQGTFVATFEDESSVQVVKLDQLGTDVQVFSSSYSVEGDLIAAEADYAMELDGTDFADFDHTNPEDMYWQTTINQWGKDYWNGNVLLWDLNGFTSYFGWQFLEDNSGYQMGSFELAPPEFEPLFNSSLGWTKDEVTEDDGTTTTLVNINRFSCRDDQTKVCAQREWRLLKWVDGNIGSRMYVLELERRRFDSNSPWYILNGLGPRINMYEEISFDYWNETAVVEEAAVEATASAQSTFKAPKATKKPIVRTVLEPSEKPGFGL